MLTQISSRMKILVFFYDCVVIILSAFFAPILRFSVFRFDYYEAFFDIHLYFILVVYSLILYIFDLYNIKYRQSRIHFVIMYTAACLLIAILLATFFYLFPKISFGRGIWLIQIGLSYVFIGMGHLFFITVLNHHIPKKKFVIVGDTDDIKTIITILRQSEYCDIIGYIGPKRNFGIINLGDYRNLDNIVNLTRPDAIIVSERSLIKGDIERKILHAKMKGVYIYDIPELVEMIHENLPVEFINDYWLIFNSFRGIHTNEYNKRFKRIFDVIIAIAGIILASPFMFITAVIVKMESPGPILYRQVRVGYNEKNFTIYKFRSMVQHAELNGAVWAKEKDDRTTRFGSFIRKFRIDELPQFFNILRGDMTLIGPRPERPEFVENLKKDIPYYSLRHMIKPGVTGWAQINYPYGASVQDAKNKLEYDLYYMKHLSPGLDMIILVRTIRTMIFGQGGR